MKARAFGFALIVGVLSMTSGCHCFRCVFPYAGWRIQECREHHGHHGLHGHLGVPACGPVCPPCGPAYGPTAFRPPVIVPGGPEIVSGAPVMHSPAGYPSITYPPIIGTPQPLPGGTGVIPNNQLPAPMPEKDKKKDGN